MRSDFDKSNLNSEVVFINPPKIVESNHRMRITQPEWLDFQNRVEKELHSRPKMRLVGIQNIEKARDELGNLKPHTVGYMLIFEPREQTLSDISFQLEELNKKIEIIVNRIR